MSEYGSGLTFGQCCTMDKERIRHALKGELQDLRGMRGVHLALLPY